MIRMGRMIPGAVPLGMGVSGAVEGMAAFADGECKVIAKALPHPEIAAEMFCSLVAIELCLPVAAPCLLLDTDGQTLLFGSLNDGYPNFAQSVQLDVNHPSSAAIKRFLAGLREWAAAPEVASFDAWIDNRDRNPGNWLWRNKNDWLLIDHGKALNCDPAYPKGNKLHAFLLNAFAGDDKGIAKTKRAMIGAAMSFGATHAQLAANKMPDGFADTSKRFCAMLENELPGLQVNVGNLFPGQSMLT